MSLARPLTHAERDYLDVLKKNLDGALFQFSLTCGIAILPLGFIVSTFGSPSGRGTDMVAALIAGLILMALTSGVLFYGGQRSNGLAWRRGDWRLRERIAEDLLGRTALTLHGAVEEKLVEPARSVLALKPSTTGTRRYFLRVDGRRFEVSYPRWLGVDPERPIQLTYAERSGVVLSIEGVPDRLSGPSNDSDPSPPRAFKPG
ncbi:MAG: hypothetical protein VKN33_01725 [Candidatus Sericytochromatia bacterium]|nr:hypothetical protein [Candidatus Sericytochromatia bacterium]